MLTTSAILTCATAPADAFAATPDRAADRRAWTTTPSTPAASAVRRIAPRLCGSSMPSSTTISGAARAPRTRSSTPCRLASSTSATTPWCTPPRACRASTSFETRSGVIPRVDANASSSRMRSSSRLANSQLLHASGAQRLEDGIDAVDDHASAGRRMPPRARGRSRCARIPDPCSAAPRSIAGTARSSSSPSASPVSASRIG